MKYVTGPGDTLDTIARKLGRLGDEDQLLATNLQTIIAAVARAFPLPQGMELEVPEVSAVPPVFVPIVPPAAPMVSQADVERQLAELRAEFAQLTPPA